MLNPIRFRRYWPYAPRKSAAVQAVRLAAAKNYMASRGIVAVQKDSQFQYARSQGVILN